MSLYQAVAGSRILAADLNQYYNLLKGAAGEGVTFIYNAAGVLIFQPSSDPAANTEAVQIKNNAGTVQSSLTFDGKMKAADGTAAAPGLRFQSEATGWALAAASTPILSIAGTEHLRLTTTAMTFAAAATRIVPGVTSMSLRNNANNADNLLITDAGVATVRSNLVVTGGKVSLSAAASTIVPGATSLSLRNNADAADNLIILDAGGATFRTTAAVGASTASRFARTGGTLAQDAVATLGVTNSFIGLVFITNRSNAYSAIYSINGGVNTTNEVSDPAGKFTNTKDSATSINVYWETDRYKIQNKLGSGTIGYEVFVFEVDV